MCNGQFGLYDQLFSAVADRYRRMRILFASADSPYDINEWSGLPYFMRLALERQGNEVVTVEEFKLRIPMMTRLRSLYISLIERQIYNVQLEPSVLLPCAELTYVMFRRCRCDVVFSPLTGSPVTAFVDPIVPVVSYGDATKYDWISTYSRRKDISKRSWKIIEHVDREIIGRHRAVIFSSDWARRCAAERYPEAAGKTHVVPFGANISDPPPRRTVERRLDHLPTDSLNLLFLGKEWERKGGPDVVRLAQALHGRGIPVKLRIIGCTPPREVRECPFVDALGFLDKSRPEDRRRYDDVMLSTHFMLMFPHAEAYGLAFCEANAFGVPVLATPVGGISTIVSDGINGRMFAQPIECNGIGECIIEYFRDRSRYREMAINSRRAYETKLNWDVAGAALQRIVEGAAAPMSSGRAA